MITYNEMYQAQQRYEDLKNAAKPTRYNEVLREKPGAAHRLMQHLRAALNNPAAEPKSAASQRLATR
jgi:hypothetical protein